jgi:hypothetical protein
VSRSASAADAEALLADAFADFETVGQTIRVAQVSEQRNCETYTLASTLLTWVGLGPTGE